MLWLVVFGLHSLAGAAHPDWLQVAIHTTDSHDIYAHDLRSGALIKVSTGLGIMASESQLTRVRQSSRVVSRHTGAADRITWETFELSDPAAGARSLREDMGADPEPGSWPEALLEALTPPAPCGREVKAFVGADKRMLAVGAVVCSPEQRERLDQYVETLAREGVLPPAERLGSTQTVGPEDMGNLSVGTPVDSVGTQLGGPLQVWPCYPRGFTWLYPVVEALGAYVALDFDDQRRLVRVRTLSEARWK